MKATEFAARCRQVVPNMEKASFRESLKRSIKVFHVAVAEVFDRKVDANGVPWPPRRSNPPNPMLIRSTAMFRAATGESNNTETVGDRQAEAGIDDSVIFYAKIHQFGSARIDRRQFYYLPKRRLPNVRLPVALRMREILIKTMRGEI